MRHQPSERLEAHLLLLQLFLGVLAATGLVLGAAVDVRKRAEAERMALVEQLREAVRMRDEFLSVASHELKTPLAALSLQVEALTRQLRRGAPHDEAQQSKALERIQRQVVRLRRLIEALLDISRIASGRLLLERGPVELGALVGEVLESHRAELEQAQAPVQLEVEPGLVGQWDRLRLEQVLTNLLINATKFGAGHPIEVQARRVQGQAELRVRDRGIGIHPRDQARIFERFERAVSARSFGGLGLGLYVSRQIVLEHGGTLRVESEPGQGATFIVELPLEGS
jgi:signal transduction histidine kinase